MSISTTPLFIPLLNEGTDVFRPTNGVGLGSDIFRVEPTDDYDPELEEWAFPPGSQVRCQRELRGGREVLVARELVPLVRAI